MKNIKNRKSRSALLVAAILIVALLIVALLIWFKPVAEPEAVIIKIPEVESVAVKEQTVFVPVLSQGTIEASRQILLSAEVSGKIIWVAEGFKDGAHFEKDKLLLKIDDRDYQLAVVKAQAQVAAAEQVLERAKAEAEQAKKDLLRLSSAALERASPYALRQPQLKEAQARLKAASADLSLARLKLAKTRVYAPFDGRILKRHVDIGQFVMAGSGLLDIYDGESMEVRLPVSMEQLNLLFGQQEGLGSGAALRAKLYSATGQRFSWPAVIRRPDAAIDAQTQTIKLVAELQCKEGVSCPLPGLFVEADIQSAQPYPVFIVPRHALHGNNELWLLNDKGRLHKVFVDILYKDAFRIYISSGLQSGQKVIISAIDGPVEGMQLENRPGAQG